MTRPIGVNCPECGKRAKFICDGVTSEKDALMLISLDHQACRQCGARLVKLVSFIEDDD